jgi:hypothetical protein
MRGNEAGAEKGNVQATHTEDSLGDSTAPGHAGAMPRSGALFAGLASAPGVAMTVPPTPTTAKSVTSEDNTAF